MIQKIAEIAPRGTWNEDIASREDDEARRSVSPYRDPTEAMRARRAELVREIDGIDAQLRGRARLAREIVALDGQLRTAGGPSRAATAVRWITRGAGTLIVLVAAASLWGMYAPRKTSVLAHEGPGVVRVDGSRFVIARGVVDRLIATRGEGARLSPLEDAGVIIGLRVGQLAPASELASLGLQEGDVIVAVDDHRVGAPDGARDAVTTLRNAWRFELVLVRDKRERRLSYEVVG